MKFCNIGRTFINILIMRTVRLIVGVLTVIMGIGWIANAAAIAGICAILVGLLVLPGVVNSLAKAANVTITRPVKIAAAVALAAVSTFSIQSSLSAKEAENKKKGEQANAMVADARLLLKKGDAEGAKAKIIAAQKLHTNDSAQKEVAVLLTQVKKASDVEEVDLALAKLSDAGFTALKKGDKIAYYDDPDVNEMFLANMRAKAMNRPRLRKEYLAAEASRKAEEAKAERERKAEAAREEEAKAAVGAIARGAYETSLRNSFLDGGLDIKVNVSGKNNSKLTLTFALFNDVWTRKLQTSGRIQEWRDMGFKRIDITDGYDYHIYFE